MNASWTNSLWVDAAGGLLLGGIVLAASWLYAAGNGSCEHESEAGHCALRDARAAAKVDGTLQTKHPDYVMLVPAADQK